MIGTTNAALLARRELAVPRGIGSAMAVFAARAENAEIHDVEGRRFMARVDAISLRNDAIGKTEVRGPGAVVGFDVIKRGARYEPGVAATNRLTRHVRNRSLILLSCGVFGSAIRILVPVAASEEVIDEGLDLLDDACVAANSN